jgi:hypothetical protein
MSDGHEPTLGDVLAAVITVGDRVVGIEGKVAGIEGEIAGLKGKIEAQGRKHDELRVALMDRIDRMQNSLTQRTEDVSVLLDLMVTNQKIAERGLSEARFGVDRQSSMATTMATFERQLRQLRDDVEELRNRH